MTPSKGCAAITGTDDLDSMNQDSDLNYMKMLQSKVDLWPVRRSLFSGFKQFFTGIRHNDSVQEKLTTENCYLIPVTKLQN